MIAQIRQCENKMTNGKPSNQHYRQGTWLFLSVQRFSVKTDAILWNQPLESTLKTTVEPTLPRASIFLDESNWCRF